jgi:hypothetical protein
MKQVIVFRTKDGATFNNESDGAMHEFESDLLPIIDSFFRAEVMPQDIVDGILKNVHKIHALLATVVKYIPLAAEDDDS